MVTRAWRRTTLWWRLENAGDVRRQDGARALVLSLRP
jgi:hypothetical protein